MNGAIFDVLPYMDFLLQQLEMAKETYLDSPMLASCINLVWSKLNKYYEATDDSTVYTTAVMLDPRLKQQYFDRNWKKCWIETAELHFKRLVRDYSGTTNVSTTSYVGNPNSITPRPILSSWKYKEKCNTNKDVDELKEYFKLPLEDEDVSPRQWWVVNQYKFPILSAIARDFLYIPAMSAEVERVFSGYTPVTLKANTNSAKLLITDRRNRLKQDIIEASECYNSWRKCGLVDSALLDITGDAVD
jgi:hypothetical protein